MVNAYCLQAARLRTSSTVLASAAVQTPGDTDAGRTDVCRRPVVNVTYNNAIFRCHISHYYRGLGKFKVKYILVIYAPLLPPGVDRNNQSRRRSVASVSAVPVAPRGGGCGPIHDCGLDFSRPSPNIGACYDV